MIRTVWQWVKERWPPTDDRSWDAMISPTKTKTKARLQLIDAAYFLIGLGLLMTYAYTGNMTTLAGLAIVLGLSGFGRYRRARAYADGWYEGRQAMSRSLTEATQRGISLNDWHLAEQDRTYRTVMGDDRL